MTFSRSIGSIGRLIAAPRWITVDDLELTPATKKILKESWPFEKTDFGGGVASITLQDLAKNQENLLSISGVGKARAEEIRSAIKKVESEIFPYRI